MNLGFDAVQNGTQTTQNSEHSQSRTTPESNTSTDEKVKKKVSLIQENENLKRENHAWMNILTSVTQMRQEDIHENPSILDTIVTENVLQLLFKPSKSEEREIVINRCAILQNQMEEILKTLATLQIDQNEDINVYKISKDASPSTTYYMEKYKQRQQKYSRVEKDQPALRKEYVTLLDDLNNRSIENKEITIPENVLIFLQNCSDKPISYYQGHIDNYCSFKKSCQQEKERLEKTYHLMEEALKKFEFRTLWLLAMIENGKYIREVWFQLAWQTRGYYKSSNGPMSISKDEKVITDQEKAIKRDSRFPILHENAYLCFTKEDKQSLKYFLSLSLDYKDTNPLNFIGKITLEELNIEEEERVAIALFVSTLNYMYENKKEPFQVCLQFLHTLVTEHPSIYHFLHALLHFFECQAKFPLTEKREKEIVFRAIYQMEMVQLDALEKRLLKNSPDSHLYEINQQDFSKKWITLLLNLTWLSVKNSEPSSYGDYLLRFFKQPSLEIEKIFKRCCLEFLTPTQLEKLFIDKELLHQAYLFIQVRYLVYVGLKAKESDAMFEKDLKTLEHFKNNEQGYNFLHTCLHYYYCLSKFDKVQEQESLFKAIWALSLKQRQTFDYIVAMERLPGTYLEVDKALFEFGDLHGMREVDWGFVFLRLSKTKIIENSANEPVMDLKEHVQFLTKVEKLLGFKLPSYWITEILFNKNFFHKALDYIQEMQNHKTFLKTSCSEYLTIPSKEYAKLEKILFNFIDDSRSRPRSGFIALTSSSFTLKHEHTLNGLMERLFTIYLQNTLQFALHPHPHICFSKQMPKNDKHFQSLVRTAHCNSILESFPHHWHINSNWHIFNENKVAFQVSICPSLEEQKFIFFQIPLELNMTNFLADEKLCGILKDMIQFMGEESFDADKDPLALELDQQFYKQDIPPIPELNTTQDSRELLNTYVDSWLNEYPYIKNSWDEYATSEEKIVFLHACFKFVKDLKIRTRKAIWGLEDSSIRQVSFNRSSPQEDKKIIISRTNEKSHVASFSLNENMETIYKTILKNNKYSYETILTVQYASMTKQYKLQLECILRASADESFDEPSSTILSFQPLEEKFIGIKMTLQEDNLQYESESEIPLMESSFFEKFLMWQCENLIQRFNQ